MTGPAMRSTSPTARPPANLPVFTFHAATAAPPTTPAIAPTCADRMVTCAPSTTRGSGGGVSSMSSAWRQKTSRKSVHFVIGSRCRTQRRCQDKWSSRLSVQSWLKCTPLVSSTFFFRFFFPLCTACIVGLACTGCTYAARMSASRNWRTNEGRGQGAAPADGSWRSTPQRMPAAEDASAGGGGLRRLRLQRRERSDWNSVLLELQRAAPASKELSELLDRLNRLAFPNPAVPKEVLVAHRGGVRRGRLCSDSLRGAHAGMRQRISAAVRAGAAHIRAAGVQTLHLCHHRVREAARAPTDSRHPCASLVHHAHAARHR